MMNHGFDFCYEKYSKVKDSYSCTIIVFILLVYLDHILSNKYFLNI